VKSKPERGERHRSAPARRLRCHSIGTASTPEQRIFPIDENIIPPALLESLRLALFLGGHPSDPEERNHLQYLCKRLEQEKDPHEFHRLVLELNELLEHKQSRPGAEDHDELGQTLMQTIIRFSVQGKYRSTIV
jgi:hypothetical protein